jgi:hypothetical protein
MSNFDQGDEEHPISVIMCGVKSSENDRWTCGGSDRTPGLGADLTEVVEVVVVDEMLTCVVGLVSVNDIGEGRKIYKGAFGTGRKFEIVVVVVDLLVLGRYTRFVVLVGGGCGRACDGGFGRANQPRWLA